jgi:survival-of-motor-neuron-related-splicing factor 30
VNTILGADPHNPSAALIPDLEDGVATADAALKPLHKKLADLQAQLPQAPEVAAPKFDPEKHPLLKKNVEKTEPEKPVSFRAGDMCEAQWHDKSWYKVKIQTVLGSASAPKYHVKFIEYEETMTVDRDAVRPFPSKRKREPEMAAATPSAPVTSTPHVISGPVSVNVNAQAAKADLDDAPFQPRKNPLKNKNAMKKTVANWKDFSSSRVGKKVAKPSMFRSGTNFGSRVGFTGSGSGMTETQKRVRYDNKADIQAENGEEAPSVERPRYNNEPTTKPEYREAADDGYPPPNRREPRSTGHGDRARF